MQGVALPLHAHVLGLDGDAALALQIHRIEVLLAHFARVDGLVSSRMRSLNVDLPWSMWAMIEKLRMRDCSMRGGRRPAENEPKPAKILPMALVA